MMDQIDSIIFDYGGVIINICYENTIAALSRLSQLDMSQFYTQHQQTPLFDQYETGQISSAQFRDGLRSLLTIDCPDQDLDDAWNAMLLTIPEERIHLLKKIGQQKRIFLLSNTNEIHRIACDQIVENTFGTAFGGMATVFETVYYSYEMGDRKPNPSIFRRVIQEQQLEPTRTLFIDDSRQHIDGAQTVGLQTIHLTNGLTINDLFKL